MMKEALFQHAVSAAGQAAAALPPIVVLMALSRSAGLEAAGAFTIAAGVSAAVFATAFWALRTELLIERFRTVPSRAYLAARLVALVPAALVVLALTAKLDLDFALLAGLVLYKCCDGLVDLEFGTLQVRANTGRAIRRYAVRHGVKLLLLAAGVGLAWGLRPGAVPLAFAGTGILLLGWIAYRTAAAMPGDARNFGLATVGSIYAGAAWFALAAAACAIVTSAPRFALGRFYEGETLGIVGVTLSAATLFGMVLQTSWARHLPRFGPGTVMRRIAAGYLTELAAVIVALGLLTVTVLPAFVEALFGMEAESASTLVRDVLLAGLVFFGGMAVLNLYKVTRRRWLETAGYTLGFVVPAVLVVIGPPVVADIRLLLAIAGAVMFTIGMLALFTPPAALLEPIDDGRVAA